MSATNTFDNDSISDLHKDAYGVRPGPGFMQRWVEATDAERQEQWDWLVAVLRRHEEEEAEVRKTSVMSFEKRVSDIIGMGAQTRETALEWIMDADECNGDWDYLCYRNNLPYGYFMETK